MSAGDLYGTLRSTSNGREDLRKSKHPVEIL